MQKSYRLRIKGIVQGVGFRPFVAKLAGKLNLNGYIENREMGVEIVLFCAEKELETFLHRLKIEKPAPSKILELSCEEIKTKNGEPDGFIIKASKKNGEITAFIPPDIAICNNCLKEMFNPENRRYLYPFTNCSHCGPRFSIIKKLPYDRPLTTMKEFLICSQCESEYTDPDDRRYHAQTNCCPECGPRYWLETEEGKVFPEEAVSKAIDILEKGGILAVKGIGGFHLMCDPYRESTVQRLRRLKDRPFKPFALMARDIETVKEFAEVSSEEEELLVAPSRPIVLLKKKKDVFEAIAPGTDRIGVMLPYTGIHYLLLRRLPVLIATSGNLSGEMLCAENREAKEKLSHISDAFLFHNREILNRCDDSVVKVVDGKKVFIRRSRGFVPEIVPLPVSSPSKLFCAGGDLKSVFGYVKGNAFYPSQYLGDLQFKLNQDQYLLMTGRFEKLFDLNPDVVVVDMHPGYFSRWLGELIAEQKGAKLVECQHHVAHVYSAMAEHRLESCIGVAFDGTGYGTDGTIWGGEFFFVERSHYHRKGWFRRVVMPGGEKAAKKPDLMATAYLFDAGMSLALEKEKLVQAASIKTSSVGRLFDAVASLLEICHENTYEGEAAMKLEGVASRGGGRVFLPFGLVDSEGAWEVDLRETIREILRLKERRVSIGELSYAFHHLLARVVLEICKKLRDEISENNVCLSGGVFQNSLLLSMCRKILSDSGFFVYTNEQVSPNDEGIALGQAYFYMLKERDLRW
ncbi:carbamoyltransferase HypF [Kosmotoga pacifica]|uniref:Carbamoyltransferase n=1 Tax=Kosmotoga pacifica TaxID=1330330 RepID=A0A0G2Z7K7_9BACT|nr:carbamoyltransferase HypF [Kosmotoga pacifica]AKI97580.1 hypothetical protein IX53_06840 [Kosmotoga pacifica]